MKKKIDVGIVGCGAIGNQLAEAIRKRFSDKARVAYLADLDFPKAIALRKKFAKKRPEILSIEDLVVRSDLIIESASQQAAQRIIRLVGTRDKMVLIMSVGGVLRAKRVSLETFEHSKAKYWIPSGAVAGIDGLLAAKEGGIRKVKLITRKPPSSLEHADYFRTHRFPVLSGMKQYRVFRGSAEKAVRAFPQNINVAAILSFAGIGARRTQVELWTSRAYTKNRHEIMIEYKTGKIRIDAENDPLPENPKTSALAVYAAIATLRRIFSQFRVGT